MITNMQDESKDLAQIMRFQQSLLRLVTRDTTELIRSKNPASDQTQQLEVWAKKVHPTPA